LILDTIVSLALVPDADRIPQPSRAEVARVASAASLTSPRWRPFAKCVEHRESKGVPTVVNSSGHAGLFQFSRDWRHGLPFMVADRLRAHGLSKGAAAAIRRELSAKPINKWSATYQRIGFAEVVERGGWRHWYLAGSRCNGLAS